MSKLATELPQITCYQRGKIKMVELQMDDWGDRLN